MRLLPKMTLRHPYSVLEKSCPPASLHSLVRAANTKAGVSSPNPDTNYPLLFRSPDN